MPDYETCAYCTFCWWSDMESVHKCGRAASDNQYKTIELKDTCDRFKRSKYLGGGNDE